MTPDQAQILGSILVVIAFLPALALVAWKRWQWNIRSKIEWILILCILWNVAGISSVSLIIWSLSARPATDALVRFDAQGSLQQVVRPGDSPVWKGGFVRVPHAAELVEMTRIFAPGLRGERRYITCALRLEVKDYDEYFHLLTPARPHGEASSSIDSRDQRTFNEMTFQALLFIRRDVLNACLASSDRLLAPEEIRRVNDRLARHPEILRRGLGATLRADVFKP